MEPQVHWTEYVITIATAGAVAVALWLGLRDGYRRRREMKARREILASRIATLCSPIREKLPTDPNRESQELLLIAATRELLRDKLATEELITTTKVELKELAQEGWVLKDYERSELGTFIALLSRLKHTKDPDHRQALIQSILIGAHALGTMMLRAYATGNRERNPEEIRQQKHLKKQLRKKPQAENSRMFITVVFLVGSSAAIASAEEIVIPAINIPERVIPGYTIPGRIIPGREGPYGTIPEIVIPPTVIPDIVLPAVNTKRAVIELPEYHLISRQAVIEYGTRNTILEKREFQLTHLPMAHRDRARAFAEYDTQASEAVIELFSGADLDRSGDLSWQELHAFQQRLLQSYSYISNRHALHPSDFLVSGGGDCEDFSLITALLARYWGWDAYVACFFDDRSGHAIAMIRAPVPIPRYYQSFDLSGFRTLHGDIVRSGRYVPVDYDYVGGYSNALRAGMKMEYVLNPERMYGEVM